MSPIHGYVRSSARQALASDIAPLSSLAVLRFAPAQSAGSAHLMTPQELDAAIRETERRVLRSHPGSDAQLTRLRAEMARQARETDRERADRLRRRIAWEVAMDRKVAKKAARMNAGDPRISHD